jgi:PAS domain S-box-containing protein
MKPEEISRHIESMHDRLRSWDRAREADDFDPHSMWEQASTVLGVSVEEMRAVEEELRQQTDELAESRLAVEVERQRYRDLFDFAPDGYVVSDTAGVVREANRAAGDLLGVPAPFLSGKPLAIFIPFEERSSFRGGLNRLLRSGRRDGWLVRFQGRDRGAFQASLTAEVIRDWGGSPVAVRWMIRDVADLIRSLCPEAVAGGPSRPEGADGPGGDQGDEAAYLRDLLDGAGVILWEADAATGRYTFISPRAEQMLGYPAGRWLSDPAFCAAIVHPEDRHLARSRRLACLRDGRPCELEYRALAEDGRVVWFRESLRPVPAQGDRPAVLRGCLWDISRRKKVERQLYTDRRKLAERLADVSYLYSLEGQLLAKTDLVPVLEEVLGGVVSLLGAELGAIRLLDRGRDELEIVVNLGLSPAYIEAFGRVPIGVGACGLAVERRGPVIVRDIEAEAAATSWAGAARLGGYRASFSVPLMARDGSIMGAVAAFFREPHRPTERQVQLVEQYVLRASDAIDNARCHLAVRESDRRKEEFFAALAHELRSPLAAIRDWAQLLQPGPDLDETLREAREVIVRQAGIMSRLVDDLLDAARLCRGGIALRKEPVDVAALVLRTAADLRPLIESRGQQLEVALPDAPAWLEADPTRLGQVLTNLLTNAAKYTDPGGRIDLIATDDREAGEIVLRVRDTGIGLAPEALSQIFGLFAQAEPARDRARGGLGIGLALVKTLVELHGGTVSADSPGPGRGSEFVVRLPAGGRRRKADTPQHPTRGEWGDRHAMPPAPPAQRGCSHDSRTEAA